MLIKLIVAVDLNGGIGSKGIMPWPRLKTDLKRFKDLTTGHPIIMGRVTAESIGKPLPNRTNIVLSKSPQQTPGFVHAGNILRALEEADRVDEKECWVIGGADVYEQLAPQACEIHMTIIHRYYDCDRFFPKMNLHGYKQSGVGYVEENDSVRYTYKVFTPINYLFV